MKILLLSSFYPPVSQGGAEKAAALLAEALAGAGHEVIVISCHPGRDSIVEECNGVRIHRIPLDNLYFPAGRKEKDHALIRTLWHGIDIWNPLAAARVGRILDREQPDVVHSHVIAGFSVSVWHEVRKRGIRLVHTLHDYYMLCVRSSMFRAGHACERQCAGCKAFTAVRKAASPTVDGLVSVSGHVLQQHQSLGYFDGVPASVLYNVMDAPVAASAIPERTSGPLVFGFIGKVEEAKGIRILLEATKLLADLPAGNDWRLKIAGSGLESYVCDLKERFPDPRIEWVGFVSSSEFYRAIDVAVVPSIWADPLPYVTIEALFADKALIGAKSGGIPEIAALCRTVALFAPGDNAELAAKMEEALADAGRWRSGGFLDPASAERFSAPTVAEAYCTVYRTGP